MVQQIRDVVNSCQLCDRSSASFSAKAPQLQTLPSCGMFYRWGVDLAGPMSITSSTGNRYLMIAVKHLSNT
jgi:hypothetical protein